MMGPYYSLADNAGQMRPRLTLKWRDAAGGSKVSPLSIAGIQ